jgi:eukaryotic-like serine/threonine-protein kinase
MIDRVGQVLGGRYRLIAPIGTGASASVYLADDVTLRRRVAVKILHDALADDAAFLKRFRAEAHAAAALNHPHVMAIYDWGQGDVPYLVTEYLGGGSLRSMLDLGRHLSTSQALLVGLEASRGLEYAHRRGFVHRDIKPANLLFDEDARLRIADFGLARALAEAAWTEPLGAVLGTARYASPEQARGASLDGKSDVYSLGLALIEAVTGTVPFASDTTIGTLMARVDQPLVVPEEMGPLVPALERAGHPDPDQRVDATAFGALLMDAASSLGRPAPLPLAGAMAADLDLVDDRDPTTQYLAERNVIADFEPAIMAAPPGTTTDGITIVQEGDGQPETRRLDRDDRSDRNEHDGSDTGGRTRRRRWPMWLGLVVLMAALAGGGAYWWFNVREVTYPVPELVGTSAGDLDALLADTEWVVERTETRQDGTVPGQILSQDPAAGTELEEGGLLRITVSLGQTLVPVPTDLLGLTLEEATGRLEAAGLALGEVGTAPSEDYPTDIVLAYGFDPPNELPKGDAVPLIVSAGPLPRTVPQGLIGLSATDAQAQLEELRLVVERRAESSESVPEGIVMNVDPGGGTTVARDSTVTLVVSSGPPTVEVPATRGLSAAEAAQRLQAAGLVVTSTQGSPANAVTGTSPAAGTTVRRGSSVVIITG